MTCGREHASVRNLRTLAIESGGGATGRSNMPELVEFIVRLSDMRKATKHLSFNRAGFRDTDSADLLVSQCVATFRAVGTEIEVPVQGTRSGTVRLPLKQLRDLMEIANTYKKREVQLHFEPGVARIETCVRRHPDISLGIPSRSKARSTSRRWSSRHAGYRTLALPGRSRKSRAPRTRGSSSETNVGCCFDSVRGPAGLWGSA